MESLVFETVNTFETKLFRFFSVWVISCLYFSFVVFVVDMITQYNCFFLKKSVIFRESELVERVWVSHVGSTVAFSFLCVAVK